MFLFSDENGNAITVILSTKLSQSRQFLLLIRKQEVTFCVAM